LGDGPAELCGLLLLGRTDQTGSTIKEASVESGCAHILALSGMHLQILAGIAASIVSLFFGKRAGRKLSVLPVVAFLCIAGPKPSLVRSAAMYFLAIDSRKRCSIRDALSIACVVQLFIFPSTIATLGCVLSYSSLAGMMLVQETVSQAVRTFLPRRLAAILSAHASALIYAGPCAIVVFGCWYPVGLLIVPLVGPLAFLYMALGLFWLLFPLPATAYLMQQAYRLFLFLLGVGADWSHAHPLMGTPGYLFFYLAALLTVVGFLLYACRIARTRSAHRHDMGLPLRFPECNHRLIG
jgi:competence protein ComEC